MAMFNSTCPQPGDLDNTLLGKIAQSLCEGGGGAGVSGLSVNGGPFQTGQVSITTGGGGGSVTSVNGDPGPAVLLDSGEIPEGANLYFTNARAIASTLTGFVAAPGVVTAADSILSAFQKVVGNAGAGGVTSVNGDVGPAVLLDSGEIPEGLNLYFTEARVLGTDLAGFVSALGAITAADTVLSAFGKAQGRLAALEAGTAGPFVLRAGDTMTGALLGANGTAALPMFSFSTDPDNGMYLLGANTLGLSAGGSAWMIADTISIATFLPLRAPSGSAATPVYSFAPDPDTGLYSSGANVLGVSTAGVLRLSVSTAAVLSTLPFLGPDGTAAAPSHTFGSDPDNGMYLPSANTLGFSTAGVLRLSVSATSVLSTVPFLGANGTAAAPTFSFSGDPDNGMYLSAADVLGLSSAGTERVTLSSTALSTTVPVRGANGSSALPTFSFTSDVNMGMFRSGSGAIGFATGGTERLTLSTTLITTTVPIQQSDSIPLGADPTAATTQWAASGEWQYRSSAASEGAGQTNRVHNRAEQAQGSGTDYALTMAYARVDFGTTDPEVTLPTAGTYHIAAQVLLNSSALSTNDLMAVIFRNSTDAAMIGGGVAVTLGVSFYGTLFLSEIVTITASKTIQLWAQNITAARGAVIATSTNIKYVRLY